MEKEILSRMGRPGEEGDSPEAQARRKLGAFGIPRERAADLVARHGAEAALRQAARMAYRDARNPGAFFAAAIERDYAEPVALLRARWDGSGGLSTPMSRSSAERGSDTGGPGSAATDDSPAGQFAPASTDAAHGTDASTTLPAADLTIPPR